MNQLYKPVDQVKAVQEIECIETLLDKVDFYVGEGDLSQANKCVADVQKSLNTLAELQRKQAEYKRLEDLAKAMAAKGVFSKVVYLHV